MLAAAAAALALAASPALAASFSVSVAGLAFSTPDLAVAVGDSVTWSFGASPHTVTQVTDATTCTNLTAAGFDSKQLVAPNTFTHVFDKPGNFWYICTVGQHCAAGMRGVVRVAAAGSPAPSAAPSSPAAGSKPSSAAPSPTGAAKKANSAMGTSASVAAALGAVVLSMILV
ncbi:hypothetical protein HK105_207887 [Polyrhizophydium stewartii]|uniref:Phytocyanin domain-containing protein n=1 Tax=Polyrhizophydium stewartii TaxID=2732419 RepID=A0ABR4MZJ2_9FUNG